MMSTHTRLPKHARLLLIWLVQCYVLTMVLALTECSLTFLRHVRVHPHPGTPGSSEPIDLWTDLVTVPGTLSRVELSPDRPNNTKHNISSEALAQIFVWQHQGRGSAGHMVLIHCSRRHLVWQRALAASRRCLCYGSSLAGTPLDVKACNQAADLKLQYSHVAFDIVRRGSWSKTVLITDASLQPPLLWSVDAKHGVNTETVFSCNFNPLELVAMIEAVYYTEDDYWNVVTFCDSNTTVDLLSELFQADQRLARVRFNLLLLGVSRATFSAVQTTLRDGDNVVLLEPNTLKREPLPIQFAEFSLTYHPTEIQIYTCYSDCFQGASMTYVGSYTGYDHLEPPSYPLLPGKFSQLRGRQMVVVCGQYRPFCVTDAFSGELVGVEVEIIKVLAETFNFSYTFVPPVDTKWGSKNDDGTWNGMVGMLSRREADIGISGITVSAAREEAVDFLHPHWEEPSAVIVKLDSNKWNYFVETFSPAVWVSVFAMPAVVAVVLSFMYIFNDNILDGSNQESILTHKRSYTKDVITATYQNLFLAYGNLLMQGGSLPARIRSTRFVIASFWLTVIMITAVYAGNLTATLAVKKVKMPFRTLEELASDNDYILQIAKGTFRETLFKHSKQGIYKKLWNKILQDPERSLAQSREEAYDNVLRGGYAYSADKTALWEWVLQGGDCELIFLPEDYFMSGLGIILPEGSPYKLYFDKVIISLLESGLVKAWMTRYSTKDVCQSFRNPNTTENVTLDDMTYVFLYIIGFGLLVAIATLLLEWVVRYSMSRVTKPVGCCVTA